MRLLLILSFFIYSHLSFAQRHEYGFKFGFSQNNVQSINTLQFESGTINRNIIGIQYRYCFHKNFSFGAELLGNGRGFDGQVYYLDQYENLIKTEHRSAIKFRYFSLPLVFQVHTGKRLHLFAGLGIVPSLLTNVSMEVYYFQLNTNNFTVQEYPITEDFNRFDFATFTEAGIGYRTKSPIAFRFSVSYLQSATNMLKEKPLPNSLMTHKSVGFLFSFYYYLDSINVLNNPSLN